MKLILFIISCGMSFKLWGQGIGPPAGMGAAFLIIGLIMLVGLAVFIYLLYYFYKRAKQKNRYLIWVSSLLIVVVFLSSVGVVFVPAVLNDNNPLESHLTILAHKDGDYLELSDGLLYHFKDKYHRYSSISEDKTLQKGHLVMLEPRGQDGEFTIYAVSQSSAYYHYQRVKRDNLITIPLFHPAINKNEKTFEGVLVKLDGEWQADANALERALTRRDCCDVPWIKELIKRGANDQDVINQKFLLHRFFNHTDRANINQYREDITELLLAAGVNLNSLGSLGRSVLRIVISDLPSPRKTKLTDTDRMFLQNLLAEGADPNISFYNGASLLNKTIYDRRYEVLNILLDYGADVHKRYEGKQSAYELARYYLNKQKAVLSETDEVTLASLVGRMRGN